MNKKDKQENARIIDSYDYLANAASAMDCTGLIPSLPVSGAELESYESLYHYQPPILSAPASEPKSMNVSSEYSQRYISKSKENTSDF